MFERGKFSYHYTTAAKAIQAILPQRSLRMGSLAALADPRESQIWPFRVYSRDVASNSRFDPAIFAEATSSLTDRSWVLCCTRDDPSAITEHSDPILKAGFGHPRMWAQYADNFKGVCLVLSHARLHDEVVAAVYPRNLFFGPIHYSNTIDDSSAYDLTYLEDFLDNGVDATLEPHISRHHKTLFFTKHLDWRDEWEYRWVLRAAETPPLIPVLNCLAAVLLGSDCRPPDTEEIVRLCTARNIPLFSTVWHGWAFSMFPYTHPEIAGQEVLSLNGIAFSTLIPCGGVFTQTVDNVCDVRTVLIKNDGSVVPLAKDTLGEPPSIKKGLAND